EPIAGQGQMVIDVQYAALNFADLLVVQDLYQFRSEPPFAPGLEGVGTVASIGPGVEGFAVGDRVAAVGYSGALAERWCVEATNAIAVPDNMAWDTAAAMTIAYGTSYHALKQRASLAEGETLLVLGGAGGVGSAAIDTGSAMGATVIAAVSSDEKAAFCAELGADHTINYATDDLRTTLKAVAPRGIDVVYDPVGGAMSETAFRSLAWSGRHLVVGFAAGDIPSLPMNLPLLKGASLVGVFWGSFTAHEPEANRQNATEMFDMVRSGAIAPAIAETIALDDARRGLDMLASRQVMGRVLVAVADGAT
ncbi:MAG: NADPH:quinone oxidoreductase family protein, partial [Acidimicrobiia bacterium]